MHRQGEPAPVFKFAATANPEQVWRMLTDSDSTPLFFFGIKLESNWESGSPLTGTLAGIEVVTGEVLFVSVPDRLSYVLAAGPEQPEVFVTWGVQACGTGAIVCLHVDEPDTADDVVELSWQPVVTSLQALLSPGADS